MNKYSKLSLTGKRRHLNPAPTKSLGKNAPSRRAGSNYPYHVETEEDQHHSKLGFHAALLWRSGKVTDITVKFNGISYPAHKPVLSCYSTYFRDKLLAPSAPKDEITLNVPHITTEAFEALLYYMYTGQLNITCQNIGDIYTAARKLSIRNAVEECNDILSGVVDALMQPIYVYATSKKIGETESCRRSLELMARHFEQIVGSKEFLDLTCEEICEYLSCDNLATRSEVVVYLAALKWLNSNFLEREEYAVPVLNCIRFPLMTLNEVLACHSPPILPGITEMPEVKEMLLKGTCYVAARTVSEEKHFTKYACQPRCQLIKRAPMILWDPNIFDPERYAQYKMETAATLIQASYRGYKVREEIKQDLLRQNVAARKIQTTYRTYAEHKVTTKTCYYPLRKCKDHCETCESAEGKLSNWYEERQSSLAHLKSEYKLPVNLKKETQTSQHLLNVEVKSSKRNLPPQFVAKSKNIEKSANKEFEKRKRGFSLTTEVVKDQEKCPQKRALSDPHDHIEMKMFIPTENFPDLPRVSNSAEKNLQLEESTNSAISGNTWNAIDYMLDELTENKSLVKSMGKQQPIMHKSTTISYEPAGIQINSSRALPLATDERRFSASQKNNRKEKGETSIDIYRTGGQPKNSTSGQSPAIDSPSLEDLIMQQSKTLKSNINGQKVSYGIILFGGYENSKNPNSTVMRCYVPALNKWSNFGNMQPARHSFCTLYLDGYIYCIGGCSSDVTFHAKKMVPDALCYRCEVATKRWAPIANLRSSRIYHGAAVVMGQIYVAGGKDKDEKILDTIEYYISEEDSWEVLRVNLESPKFGVGVCCFSNQLWIVGGLTKDFSGNIRAVMDVEVYDPLDNRIWQNISKLPRPCGYTTLVVCQNEVYILGGVATDKCGTDEFQSMVDVSMFNERENKWISLAPLPTPRHLVTAVTFGDAIFLLNSETTFTDTEMNQVYVYSKDMDSWRPCAPLSGKLRGTAAITIPQVFQ